MLSSDPVICKLLHKQLQSFTKQAHRGDMQVSLAKALKLKTFLNTTSGHEVAAQSPQHDLQDQRAKLKMKSTSRKVTPVHFPPHVGALAKKGTSSFGALRNEGRVITTGCVLKPFSLAAKNAIIQAIARVPAKSLRNWRRRETQTNGKKGQNPSHPSKSYGRTNTQSM